MWENKKNQKKITKYMKDSRSQISPLFPKVNMEVQWLGAEI